jgi:hypothetical protein
MMSAANPQAERRSHMSYMALALVQPMVMMVLDLIRTNA